MQKLQDNEKLLQIAAAEADHHTSQPLDKYSWRRSKSVPPIIPHTKIQWIPLN